MEQCEEASMRSKMCCLAVCTTITRSWLWTHARLRNAHGRTSTWTRAGLDGWVGAEHANSRSELRSTKRDHVLANMTSNMLTVLRVGVSQDILDQVVAVLITGNVDQRNAGSVVAAFADAVEVAAEEVGTTNLEALLNNLRSKLIHTVLGGIADDVINGAAAISWGTMFTDVLDAPVAKLAVSDDVNTAEDFLDARSLQGVSLDQRSEKT